jgi:enamine deaminase RidA (YjgF/YER057c/UK114 family)
VVNIEGCAKNRDEVNGIFEEMFKGKYPANSVIHVSESLKPSLTVEIETIAVY